jgi:hypothetical protein
MKRILTLLASLALVASGLHILPAAAAEETPEVPEVVNIEDPFGDANTLGGDQVTPADGGSLSDIGKVWFSNDAANLNVHFLTEGAPGATAVGLLFEVKAGDAGCLVFEGFSKGTTYASDNLGRVTDNCNKIERAIGEFTFGAGPGTAGLATITVPRTYSPLFADGASITAPVAQTKIFVGGEQITPSGYRGAGTRVDDTKAGTDYVVVGDSPATPAKPAKPAKPTTPVKKGCDKGSSKAKKNGCKKTPAPKNCAPFTPGEAGKDKPTVTLTDAATEAKPVEQKIKLAASAADADLVGELPDQGPLAAAHDAFNIQVDAAAADAGLYALIEFPSRRDYDLNLLHLDGSYAARAQTFNPVVGTPGSMFSVPGHGGEGTDHSEKLVGIKTSDCGGWTLDVANYLGEGGEMTVKLWLGDVVTEPQAVGAETP